MSSSVLFRLRHVKLPKASMGLQPLIRDAADEIERLQKLLDQRQETGSCTERLGDLGEADFKAGKPIDAFYDLPLKRHTELDRGRYEIGWRAAELEARKTRGSNA